MNVKNWIPLVAAVVLGLIALVVAKKALNKSGGGSSSPTLSVAIAAREMPPGTELTAADVTMMQLPVEAVPGGTFRSSQELVGRTTLQPMVKGQTLVEPGLAPTGTRGGLTALIPEGQRAMTLEINEFTGLAGMLQPGSRVDVIAVLRDDKADQTAARTVLQNIEVRAIGRNYNPQPPMEGAPPPPPTNNVTLLVSPRQAQILQLASQNGRPWLVLRNSRDKEEPISELVTLAALRDDAEASKPVADGLPGKGEIDPKAGAIGKTVDASTSSEDPFAGSPPPKAAARVVQIIRGGIESSVTLQTSPAATDPEHAGDPFAPAKQKPEPLPMITDTSDLR